jgi:hypothetical protein
MTGFERRSTIRKCKIRWQSENSCAQFKIGLSFQCVHNIIQKFFVNTRCKGFRCKNEYKHQTTKFKTTTQRKEIQSKNESVPQRQLIQKSTALSLTKKELCPIYSMSRSNDESNLLNASWIKSEEKVVSSFQSTKYLTTITVICYWLHGSKEKKMPLCNEVIISSQEWEALVTAVKQRELSQFLWT